MPDPFNLAIDSHLFLNTLKQVKLKKMFHKTTNIHNLVVIIMPEMVFQHISLEFCKIFFRKVCSLCRKFTVINVNFIALFKKNKNSSQLSIEMNIHNNFNADKKKVYEKGMEWNGLLANYLCWSRLCTGHT